MAGTDGIFRSIEPTAITSNITEASFFDAFQGLQKLPGYDKLFSPDKFSNPIAKNHDTSGDASRDSKAALPSPPPTAALEDVSINGPTVLTSTETNSGEPQMENIKIKPEGQTSGTSPRPDWRNFAVLTILLALFLNQI